MNQCGRARDIERDIARDTEKKRSAIYSGPVPVVSEYLVKRGG